MTGHKPPERLANDAARCTFTPQGGGSWRQCMERATLAAPVQGHTTYRERRCQKHYDLDMRTAKRRGYGEATLQAMVLFDAQAEYDAVYAAAVAAQKARTDERWSRIAAAVEKRDIVALRELVR